MSPHRGRPRGRPPIAGNSRCRMTDKERGGRSGRTGAWAALIFGSFAIFIRAAAGTHSIALGVVAVAVFGAFIVGLLVWSRGRAEAQIESSISSGQLQIELGLDFSCLPGD